MCHWGWALQFQKPMPGPVCLYLSLTVFLSIPPLQTRKEPSVKPMLQHQGMAVEGVFFPTAWLAEQPSLNAAKIWARMFTPITVPLVQMTVVLESITGHVLCRTISRQCFPSSPKVGSGRLCVTVVVRSGVFGGSNCSGWAFLNSPVVCKAARQVWREPCQPFGWQSFPQTSCWREIYGNRHPWRDIAFQCHLLPIISLYPKESEFITWPIIFLTPDSGSHYTLITIASLFLKISHLLGTGASPKHNT